MSALHKKKWRDKVYRGPAAVALDFDGTLVESRRYPAFGPLKRGAVEAWQAFEAAGLKIIVFTARQDKRPLWAFFRRRGLKPWRITSRKPKEAYAMVDDRAVSFTGEWGWACARALEQVEEEKRRIARREHGRAR